MTTCLSVLHPHHKLQYFECTGWQPDWIKTVEEIVRAKFEESYAAPADDSDDVDMSPPASYKKGTLPIGIFKVSPFDTYLPVGMEHF